MAEYIDLDTPLEVKVAWGSTYKPYTSTLRELLDVNHIPYTAADVRSVVRARWNTVKYPLYECSNCGAVYQDVGYGFNFCPNCGADMREKS